jgi:hypothetical protein
MMEIKVLSKRICSPWRNVDDETKENVNEGVDAGCRNRTRHLQARR